MSLCRPSLRPPLLAAALLVVVVAAPVRAQMKVDAPDGDLPGVAGNLYLQLEADKVVHAPRGTPPNLNVYVTDSYLQTGIYLNRQLSFQSTLWLTQTQSPTKSAFLYGQAGMIQQAFLNYETDRFAAFAGKFNPAFSTFWVNAPGIYGNNFSENNYWIVGADGLGGALKVDGGDWGKHRFSAAAWFLDNSAFSTTVGTRAPANGPNTIFPGRLFYADGGAGNTGNLQSYTLSWRSTGLGGNDNLVTNLDFSSLAPGLGGTARQNEIAAGVQYQIPLGGDWSLQPLAELVQMWNRNGNVGGIQSDVTFFNAGASLNWGNWTLNGVWGARNITGPIGTGSHDRLYTASFGYNFDSGMGAQVGWNTMTISGISTTTLGAMVTYTKSF